MPIVRMLVLAAITHHQLAVVLRRLPAKARRGRPWSCSRRRRVLIACVALRTNLTLRELAATFSISKSAAHRIIATVVPELAAVATTRNDRTGRFDRDQRKFLVIARGSALECAVLDAVAARHQRAARR